MVAIKNHGLKLDLMAKEDWPLVRQLGQTLVLHNGRSNDKKSWKSWRKTMKIKFERRLWRDAPSTPLSPSKAGKAMNEKGHKLYPTLLQALDLEDEYQYLPTFGSLKFMK